MTTLAIGGILSAIFERPYSDATPLISQGAPKVGKSVGNRLLVLASCAFMAEVEVRMAARRACGSAMLVCRLTSVIDAWLLADVSPSARNDTGTAAISGLPGTRPRFSR